MPEASPSDALILAALKRAERHARRDLPGVGYTEIVAHLGLRMSSATGVRLRPRFRELEVSGLIIGVKRHGVVKYMATPKGQRLLAASTPITLPEAPQHRRWREANEGAASSIGGFRSEVRTLLAEAAAALAEDAGDSETWFLLSERLEQACWRLGSATHCLHEWQEPDDASVDIDDDRRLGRRDVTRWYW